MKSFIPLFSAAFLISCTNQDSEVDQKVKGKVLPANVTTIENIDDKFRLYNLTPISKKVFDAMISWEAEQWRFRNNASSRANQSAPLPGNCAGNVSQVLGMTGIAKFINNYRWTGATELGSGSEIPGAKTLRLPKKKADLIVALNKFYGGKIPVGTLLSGCKTIRTDGSCTFVQGDQHVGLISYVKSPVQFDAQGNIKETLMVHHNNWYRPEQANNTWFPFMVSKRNLGEGFKREWMATPWLNVIRDAQTGKILDLKTALINPVTGIVAIDDLDPMTYFVSLRVLPEIDAEIKAGLARDTDGPGN